MQRADALATRQPLVGGAGQRQAFAIVELGDDGIEARVEARDLRQVGAHHLAR